MCCDYRSQHSSLKWIDKGKYQLKNGYVGFLDSLRSQYVKKRCNVLVVITPSVEVVMSVRSEHVFSHHARHIRQVGIDLKIQS